MRWSPLQSGPWVPGRWDPEKATLGQVGAAFHSQACLRVNCHWAPGWLGSVPISAQRSHFLLDYSTGELGSHPPADCVPS